MSHFEILKSGTLLHLSVRVS